MFWINVLHEHFNGLALLQFTKSWNTRNVDETINSRLKVDKHANRSGARNSSLDGSTSRVFLGNQTPRIREELLDREIEFPGSLFHPHHLHLNFVSHLKVFVNVFHFLPGDL